MSDRPEVPARIVWAGEALGYTARVIAGAVVCAVQIRKHDGSWTATDAVLERAALGEAVLALSGRGTLACYLLLEKQVASNEGTPDAEPLRDFMDKVWHGLLSDVDRAWLNARGAVGPAPAAVDGSEPR